MRSLAPVALALLAACASAHKQEVAAVVANDLDNQPLSCHLTLAHFVTQPSHQVPPGGQLAIAFHRDPTDGTLQVPRAAGEPMAVEALPLRPRRGLVGDLDARSPVAPPGRHDKAQGYLCRLETRLVCEEER